MGFSGINDCGVVRVSRGTTWDVALSMFNESLVGVIDSRVSSFVDKLNCWSDWFAKNSFPDLAKTDSWGCSVLVQGRLE